MHYRQFGATALHISAIGLGCNNFGHIAEDTGRSVLQKALDLGITFFDTANSYADGRSEDCLGRWLGPHRRKVVIATKFGYPSTVPQGQPPASRRQIALAVEDSLRRLRTDWIDLYQLHVPDPATPIEETLDALQALIQAGKVRYAGCSNLSAAQLQSAMAASQRQALARFESCQYEYSLLNRDIEPELLPLIRRHQLALLPFFPLASGLLTGKYSAAATLDAPVRARVVRNFSGRFLTDANWQRLGRLAQFCSERGCTMTELALSWLHRQPDVTSIMTGATTPEQIEQNVRAIDWPLTDADDAALQSLTAPH